MHKASRAVASAKLLLDAGDVDGACNRAYYGMFDAARAALHWSGAPVEPTAAKTHEKAQWVIQQAALFVEAVQRELAPKDDPDA